MRRLLLPLALLALAGCIPDDGGFARPRPAIQAVYEPPIRIIEARYGTDRRTCDATRALRRACEGESDCMLKAGNELCGDPTPGRVKTLYVTYRCKGRVRNVTRTEGKMLSLDCCRRSGRGSASGRRAVRPAGAASSERRIVVPVPANLGR